MLENKYRIVGDVAYISLTKGQETVIDVVDLEKALKARWHAAVKPNATGKYYAQSYIDGKAVSLHRFLLNPLHGEHIEHINRDTLDNRRSNLRMKSATPSRIDGDVAYITLTRGQETMIDASDLERVLPYSWHVTPNTMGGCYASASINNKTVYLHRFILDAPQGTYVDHIHHNTLDNRRANLKMGSQQENITNREGANTTSKTGIRGVSVHKMNPRGLTHEYNRSSPDKRMYVFRCHSVTCKTTKYFPYTDEGLEAAKAFAAAHYAAMEKG